MAGARVRGITIEFGGDASGLNAALKQVNASARSCQSQLRDLNRVMKLDPTNLDLAKQKYNTLQQSISATKDKLKTLKDAESQLQSEMKNGGTEQQQKQLAALQREIAATEAQMKRLQGTWGSGSASMLHIGNVLSSVGSKFTAIGEKCKAVSIAVTAFGAASVKAFTDVDAGSKKAIYATGAVGASADAIRTAYQNVAKSVAGTFEEIGSTVGEVSTRFGLTGTELENLSKKFQQFATITGQDGKSAVAGVDLALRTFNMDSSEAANVMGLLAKVSQNTGMSVQTLESLLQSSGAVLKEMGLSLAESVNLMATFEKAGIDSSTMLTSMKKAATYFSDSGKDMNSGLKDLIVRLQDAGTAAEATSEAYDIFGKRAGLAFVTAAKEGKISLEGLSADLSQYSSVVEDTYNETRTGADKMAGAWKKVKLALSGFGEAIGDVIGPWMSNLALGLGDLTKSFNKLDPAAKQTAVVLGMVAAASAPVLIAIGKMITGIGNLIRSWSSITAATNPYVAAVMAAGVVLTGLVVATNAVINANSRMSESMRAVNSEIQKDSEKWEQLNQAREKSIGSANSTAAANTGLLQTLYSLSDANGRVKESEQARAQLIINQLNSALGTNLSLQDGVILNNGKEVDSNKALVQSIQEVINQKQAQAILDANQEAYNDAIANRSKYVTEYCRALEESNRLEEEKVQLEKEQAGSVEGISAAWSGAKLAAVNRDLDEQNKKLEQAKQNLDSASNAIGTYNKVTESMVAGGDELSKTLDEIQRGITSFDGTNLEKVMSSASEAFKNVNDVAKQAKDGNKQVTQEVLDDIAQTAGKALAKLQEADALTVESISGLGEDAVRALAEADLHGKLSQDAKAGFDSYYAVCDQGMRDVIDNIRGKAPEMGEAGYAGGSAEGAGVAGGMEDQKGNVSSASQDVANAAGSGFWSKNDAAVSWGKDLVIGFARGISGAISIATEAAKNVALAVAQFLHFSKPDKGPLRPYEQWMPHMMQGMAKTLRASKKVLLNEVNRVAQGVNNAMTFDTTFTPIVKPVLDTSMMTNATIKDNSTTSVSFTDGIKKAFTEALKQSDALKPQVNQTINGLRVNDEQLVNNLIDVANNKNARREAM